MRPNAIKRLSGRRADATRATLEPALHLATSMRSFRAEHLSRFVKALLDGEAKLGRELFAEFRDNYPIVLTRNIRAARRWTEKQRRGRERAGFVALSFALRLKPHAIEIRMNIDTLHWYFSPQRDTRSSLYPEHTATETQGWGWNSTGRASRGTPTSANVGAPAATTVFRGEMNRREEARAAEVSEELLQCVAHAGPAWDGDLLATGGQTRQGEEATILRRHLSS